MNRRKFAHRCLSCLSGSLVFPVLNGCQSVYYTSGTLEANGISIRKSEFTYLKRDRALVRNYIVVRNEGLQFPVYVYRFSDDEYSAVLMKCTHQGNELEASGDHLACPAHGSEFNNRGTVVGGPADKDLRRFAVRVRGDQIFIDLRA